MNVANYAKPYQFYFLSTLIPWSFWFMAAYLSHLSPSNQVLENLGGFLGLAGLVSPMIIAYIMMRRDPKLRGDIYNRIFTFKDIKPTYILITLFLMLGSILTAQAISLSLGHSTSQFSFANAASFSFGLFPAWFLLILAPLFEELAWHSYGTDCLRARFNLFITSVIFGVFWVLWHFPLGFIKGYYHSNLAETGLLYSINFAVSLFPFVILMNWLYYKTGRNMLVAIVFHISAGISNEMFQTHPDSKVIQTVLLVILSGYLLYKDREFFFSRQG